MVESRIPSCPIPAHPMIKRPILNTTSSPNVLFIVMPSFQQFDGSPNAYLIFFILIKVMLIKRNFLAHIIYLNISLTNQLNIDIQEGKTAEVGTKRLPYFKAEKELKERVNS
jgi:hypothetical protein